MATSKIRLKKICAWCGNEFEAQKISTKYCSHRCSEHAYKDRKRQEKKKRVEMTVRNDYHRVQTEPLKDKVYLTVAETATLIGCTRDGVYKLIRRGQLKAHRISSHWTVIYRTDIDAMISYGVCRDIQLMAN